MVALYSVGALLEQVLGKAISMLLYFIGGITGNAVSYLAGMADGGMTVRPAHQRACRPVRGDSASGRAAPRRPRILRRIQQGMWGVIAANVAYSFLVPGISISGHLGWRARRRLLPCSWCPSPIARAQCRAHCGGGCLGGVLVWMLVSNGLIFRLRGSVYALCGIKEGRPHELSSFGQDRFDGERNRL